MTSCLEGNGDWIGGFGNLTLYLSTIISACCTATFDGLCDLRCSPYIRPGYTSIATAEAVVGEWLLGVAYIALAPLFRTPRIALIPSVKAKGLAVLS